MFNYVITMNTQILTDSELRLLQLGEIANSECKAVYMLTVYVSTGVSFIDVS